MPDPQPVADGDDGSADSWAASSNDNAPTPAPGGGFALSSAFPGWVAGDPDGDNLLGFRAPAADQDAAAKASASINDYLKQGFAQRVLVNGSPRPSTALPSPTPPKTFGQGFQDGFVDDFRDLYHGLLNPGPAPHYDPIGAALAPLEMQNPFEPLARGAAATVDNFTDGLGGAIKSNTVPYFAGNQLGHGAAKGTQFVAADAVAGLLGDAFLLAPEETEAAQAGASVSETGDGSSGPIPTIGGRLPRNSRYAGGVHPAGVSFTEQGFPDFTPHAIAEVKLDGLTGKGSKDVLRANQAAGFSDTPQGYVWHHVEDGKTMQLIPKSVHDAVPHTGGRAVIRNGGFDP